MMNDTSSPDGADAGGGSSSQSHHPWTCQSCTYVNPQSDFLSCAICGAQRPQLLQQQQAQTPTPTPHHPSRQQQQVVGSFSQQHARFSPARRQTRRKVEEDQLATSILSSLTSSGVGGRSSPKSMLGNDPTPILITGATGKQGLATIDAILHSQQLNKIGGGFKLFGLVRDPESSKARSLLTSRGVTPIRGNLSDMSSLVTALKVTKARRAVLITDYFSSGWVPNEAAQGRNFIKAVEEVDPTMFVVYCSTGDADRGGAQGSGDSVPYFSDKYQAEEALKGSSIQDWFILRPAAYFEKLDEAETNPLKKGKVKMLTYPDTKVKYVSTTDIGRALAAVSASPDPRQHSGRTLEFAMDECDGYELAHALTEVSGVECTYGMSLPRFFTKSFMRGLWSWVKFLEEGGYSADIEESRLLVPNGMDARDWFESKGVDKWNDGVVDSVQPFRLPVCGSVCGFGN